VATLLDEARGRGITLVATLHQVDMALAHFPRLVGLREGAVAFDLPSAEVTPPQLAQLYAPHERDGEGQGQGEGDAFEQPLAAGPMPASAPPVAMTCR
jgi:phosphonate transport system ATP-binding protein